ncbi:MAG: hypothetical protein CVT92_11935 [Bacteroidetes bacterium HGW-Bacteroidetes-1]|jgi:hypothetical protein|nr:MAG: hypothetical protein CVT92_11935 [Bacteroidetes bacterium HGW-Bacteroidetes-1]
MEKEKVNYIVDNQEHLILKILADQKWKDGFVCRKCGNNNYCKGKKAFSRRCTRCKTEESATAHTVFHRCKLPLTEAMAIAQMICSQHDVSTYEISRQLDKRQMTCWKFKTKILECLESPEKSLIIQKLIEMPVGSILQDNHS